MDAIKALLEVLERLLGPNGCPWDQKQTLDSSRVYLLEESAEVIDAIHSGDSSSIREELGDVLFVVLFLCRLAEKEQITNLNACVEAVKEKLIRRHPHVFGEIKELTPEGVRAQWEAIKKTEKKPPHPIAKIPQSLPALSRAAEILKACHKNQWKYELTASEDAEERIGHELFLVVQQAVSEGIEPELALRKTIMHLLSQLKLQPTQDDH